MDCEKGVVKARVCQLQLSLLFNLTLLAFGPFLRVRQHECSLAPREQVTEWDGGSIFYWENRCIGWFCHQSHKEVARAFREAEQH